MIIKQLVHDGLVFFFSDEAVKSDNAQIGFYFDRKGLPQSIYRNSVYGYHIIKSYGLISLITELLEWY